MPIPRPADPRRATAAGLAVLVLALTACAPAPGTPGSEHALFATEVEGAFGGGDHPADDAVWSLEAQATETCPGGYRWLGERRDLFAEGKEWTWWIRCAPAS
jgi:hypothetical protein